MLSVVRTRKARCRWSGRRRADVVEAEADGEVVFGAGLHVGCGFKEGGEGEFEAAGASFADDAVEEFFLAGSQGRFSTRKGRVSRMRRRVASSPEAVLKRYSVSNQ